jgi:phage gp36-like protein
MPYATQSDLTTRFSETELVQITTTDPLATTVDAVKLAAALADADAEIDGRLMSRYALPLAVVPRLLVNAACDIARYRLYDDRAPEHVVKRYEDAIRTLVQVGKGDIQLGLDATAQPAQVASGPSFSAPGRVFSGATLADYSGGA